MTLFDNLFDPPNPDARLSVWEDGGFRTVPWSDVVRAGERAAAGLRGRGVQRGDHVACVLTNSFDAIAAVAGIWLAGAVVVSLPTPARGMPGDAYLDQLEILCKTASSPLLLVEDDYAAAAPAGGAPAFTSFRALRADGPSDTFVPRADEPAFVQFSSGSTGEPKGCVLTRGAIDAQLEMLSERVVMGHDDLCCSWLPLSHDMGLFGGLMLPWVSGGSLRLSTPARFLRSPRTWLEDCADSGATITVGPNFGLALALRALRRAKPEGEMRVRTWILGSDQIEASLLDDAVAALEPLGIPASAFTPAYGLAEATLAVTMTERGTEPRAIEVSPDALYARRIEAPSETERVGAATNRLTSTGRPMPGVRVRIDGPGDVGEIVVGSASLASGYLEDPARTARTFVDGELRTGDLGFLHDGELYVVGRDDDMMSIGGRNLHASEVESRLCRDHPLRAGGCVLVDVHDRGRQRLVLVAEPETEELDFTATARAMRRTAASCSGVGVHECVFLARGSLPKSPSGKIQRFRCRQLVSDGAPSLARVPVG